MEFVWGFISLKQRIEEYRYSYVTAVTLVSLHFLIYHVCNFFNRIALGLNSILSQGRKFWLAFVHESEFKRLTR